MFIIVVTKINQKFFPYSPMNLNIKKLPTQKNKYVQTNSGPNYLLPKITVRAQCHSGLAIRKPKRICVPIFFASSPGQVPRLLFFRLYRDAR